jgi:CheY-like chemotaxis protein
MIKKRVLIAEDDPDTRFLLSLVLNEHGYDVVTAADGVEALALAEQHPPDDGPRSDDAAHDRSDCVRMVRTHMRLCRVPVVMVTAAAGLVKGVEDVPFDAVVEKPVELDGFVRTVRTLCPPGADRRVRVAPYPNDRRLGSS